MPQTSTPVGREPLPQPPVLFGQLALWIRATDVDKLDEISASQIDFGLVHSVDGHPQCFVHGRHVTGRSNDI